MRKKVLSALAPFLDLFFAPLIVIPAFLLVQIRRFGLTKFPLTRKTLLSIGMFPLRDHYYEPAFHPRHFAKDLSTPRDLPGLNLREADQLGLLEELNAADEISNWFDTTSDAEPGSIRIQSQFGPGDAEFLYQFIRYIRPTRIVEIGSGNSTRVANLALARNQKEGAPKAEHICIEPYEMPWLEQLGPKIIRSKVEESSMQMFEDLGPGDLLFIDSSHIIRPQGDVLHEFLEILPRLKSGVYIHIHDIFTPRNYPHKWVVDDVRFWNEQYLLEAILTASSKYQVVAALNWLKHAHFDALKRVCPLLTAHNEPGSFYLRVQ